MSANDTREAVVRHGSSGAVGSGPHGDIRVTSVERVRLDHLEPIQVVVSLCKRLLDAAPALDSPEDVVADVRQMYQAAQDLFNEVKAATDIATRNSGNLSNADISEQRHRIRNQLNRLSGFCQFVQMRESEEFVGKYQDDLNLIIHFCREHDMYPSSAPAVPASQPDKPPVLPERLRAKPGHLLIVDDSEHSRELLRRLLKPDGHELTEAVNGFDALDKMKRTSFDLVLLDIRLPGFDGFQILEELRRQIDGPQSPILVISGEVDKCHEIRCIELGAEAYLTKPIDHLLLQARVNSCLQKHQLRLRELEQFFPTQVAHQWLSKPDVLKKCRKAMITVLFCDIREYSRISEGLGPRKTIRWVNNVMEVLSDCVFRNNGVLIDFKGDELLAMWEATPQSKSEHAKFACTTALQMLTAVADLDRKWRPLIRTATEVGIGIHSGPARVGNVGIQRKFKYGALGNTVNLGSRVQGATKYLKSKLLITGATRRHLGQCDTARRVATIQVVNIKKPVELYEVVHDGHPGWQNLKPQFEQALEFFEQQKFREAAEILGDLITKYGAQGPELALLARTIEALGDGSKWKKVWVLPGK